MIAAGHPDMKAREVTALESALGYQFKRQELLEQALTHSSRAREQAAIDAAHGGLSAGDNEQLEFLGDAVLGLVTTESLFHRFPGLHEGQLSKLRAHLVGQRHLLRAAEQIEIGNYLRLGRGEEKSGGRNKGALLVDALEAIVAALYLDGGWAAARDFVLRAIVDPELAQMNLEGSALPVTDFKSALQEKLQAEGMRQPVYALVKQEGPEHRKTFTVEVRLPETEGEAFVARAEGPTKKRAEQDAARQVLEYLAASPEWQRARTEKSL